MIINKSGLTIRMEVSALRVMGRATQGVRLINIKENDSIAAVTKVMKEDEEVIDAEALENEEGSEGSIENNDDVDTSAETSESEE